MEPELEPLDSDSNAAGGVVADSSMMIFHAGPGPEILTLPDGAILNMLHAETHEEESSDDEEDSPPPPLFPEGSILSYGGYSYALTLPSGRVIRSGKWFRYTPDMDEWLSVMMPHGHVFSVMTPEQKANTPDSAIE